MRTLRATAVRSFLAATVAVAAVAATAFAGLPTQLKEPSRIAVGSFDEISMAVDGTGKVHLAATRPNGNLLYLTDRTGTWTSKLVAKGNVLSEQGHKWTEPSLALDENDRVTIAIVKTDWGGTGCDCTRGIFTYSDKGRARGTFPALGTRRVAGGSHAPSLKTANGHLYLAYRRGATVPEEPAAIRFKTNATGHWTDTKVKSFGYDYSTPALRIGDDGKARIAFATPSGIFVGTASTLSGGWSVEKVPGTNGHDDEVALSLTTTGKPVIAWTHTFQAPNGVRYASKASGSWVTQPVTSHVGKVALSLDATNQPFLAVGDNNGADAGLWTYAGATFIEDELYAERSYGPQVRVASSGIVSLAFVTPVAPKGLYLSQD